MEYQKLPVVIDEGTLRSVASMTGGKYYRATSKNVLKEIFKDIDQLEKTQLDVKNYSHTEDDYMKWAVLLFMLVGLEVLLRYTVLRHIP